VPSSPRDIAATWRTAGALCREREWSKRRLTYELENGLLYRTVPPGWTIDWSDDFVWPYFNIEASEISIPSGLVVGAIAPPPPKDISMFSWGLTLGIEVLPPGAPADAEVLPSSADAPAAPPAPKRPSDAEVERCLRAIIKERPDDPPGDDELFVEVTRRLGVSPGRDRLRQLRRRIAPQWKRPRGHPRNFNSAKKSAE
jgi:hypothetical protein